MVALLAPLAQSAGSADPESTAFVQGLLAEALAGQGELASARYREADAELMRSAAVASATVNLYIEQRGLEASLTGYEPEVDIARFEGWAAERRDELARARAELDAATRERDALVAQAVALEGQAQGIRDEEGRIRERIQAAPGADRMPSVREARKVRRQWETLFKEAEELRARTLAYPPRILEIDLAIARNERQLRSLDQAKASATARASSLREESASAGRAAQEAGEAASQALAAALAALDEGTTPAFEEASGTLSQALSKASAVRSGLARAGAQASSGTIAHALGSLQRERGESLARMASLLERVAGVTPPLAGAADHAERAARLRTESKQALIQAAESYGTAIAALGAGAGGDERAQRVAKALEEIRREILGEPEPEAAPAQDAEGEPAPPDDSPDSEEAPVPDEAPDPQTPAPPEEPAPETR